MATTFPISEILGKTLIAKQRVNLLRGSAVPDGQSFAFVSSGNPVGVVYSYLDRGPDGFFWQFEHPQQGVYYAKHQTGLFDVNSLAQQGALTTEQLIEQQQDQANDFFPGLDLPSAGDLGKWALGLLAVGFAVKKLFR